MADDRKDDGLYDAPAPVLTISDYGDLEKLMEACWSVVLTDNKESGPQAPDEWRDANDEVADHNQASKDWYKIAADMDDAMKAIDTMNTDFAAEVKSLATNLQGKSGEAFNKWAGDLLAKSQTLHDTLKNKQFGSLYGSVGHIIDWFAADFWKTLDNSKTNKDQEDLRNKLYALAQAEAAHTQSDIDTAISNYKTASQTLDDKIENQLITDLQGLLKEMGKQYTDIGTGLERLYIAGGMDSYKDIPTKDTGNEPPPDTSGDQPPPSTSGNPPPSTSGDQPPPSTSGSAPPPTTSSGGSLPPPDTSGLGAGGSPGSSGGGAPDLGAAKKAAKDALGGLGSPGGSGGGEPGGGKSGGGAPGSGSGSGALPDAGDAKKAAEDAIDKLKGQAQNQDPAVQKALDDAKKAAGDAIGAIPGGIDGSPESLQKAKKAATDAIDKLEKKTKDPKVKKALEDAKDAVGKAIDDLDPETKGALSEAKDKALGVLDRMRQHTTDPQALKAIDHAKDVVGKAIDGVDSDGNPVSTLHKAADAATKAIDDALKHTTDPAAKQALQDAKTDLADAINSVAKDKEKLPSTVSGGPGSDAAIQKALSGADGAVDKTFDDLIGKATDPGAKQALEHAKEAASAAIGGGGSPSSMDDFLSGAGSGGGGSSGGGGFGGGTETPPRAQFDTDVAQQRGFTPAAAQSVPGPGASAGVTSPGLGLDSAMNSGGLPMGGMPMGGMGGMGGMRGMGGQQAQREPQIWLQGDKNAWTDESGEQGEPVLGRPARQVQA